MISPYAEVVRAIGALGPIADTDLRRWIASEDLLTWSGIVSLLDEQPSRITPVPAEGEIREVHLRYLLRCIDENPVPGDLLHGGFEAAWELAARLRAWSRMPGGDAVVRIASVDLEKLFRRGDAAVRNRIICGVLEHVMEEPRLRPFFSNWKREDELAEALRLAVEWGKAHEGSGES